jgi:hypothetical protein
MRRAVADLDPAANPSFRFFAVSLRILFATLVHRKLKLSKRRKKSWGRHVGITEWLLVWLIVNALCRVRVLVVSQAESRDLSVR